MPMCMTLFFGFGLFVLASRIRRGDILQTIWLLTNPFFFTTMNAGADHHRVLQHGRDVVTTDPAPATMYLKASTITHGYPVCLQPMAPNVTHNRGIAGVDVVEIRPSSDVLRLIAKHKLGGPGDKDEVCIRRKVYWGIRR